MPEHLCCYRIRADGKGDAAPADSIFALCLVRECVPIIVFHWERLVLRTLHDREAAIFFDDRDVAKEIVCYGSDLPKCQSLPRLDLHLSCSLLRSELEAGLHKKHRESGRTMSLG